MKAYIDGELVKLSKEQEDELKKMVVKPQITIENRVEAIETAIADLALQQLGVNENA